MYLLYLLPGASTDTNMQNAENSLNLKNSPNFFKAPFPYKSSAAGKIHSNIQGR
jgi:hypothetical protein